MYAIDLTSIAGLQEAGEHFATAFTKLLPALDLVSAAVFAITGALVASRKQMDIIGFIWLGTVTGVGTAKGIDHGAGAVVAVMMGMITASVGGIIRDILGQEPSILLRREIYVTASLAGAITYVGLLGFKTGRWIAAFLGGLIVFIIRGHAISYGWSLPVYRPRAGRSVEDIEDE